MGNKKVHIKTGVTEAEQESSYMNGTLQHAGCNQNEDEWAFTIHTNMDIPRAVFESPDPQAALSDYIGIRLRTIADMISGMSFEVEIGPTREPDETAHE